MADDKLSIVKEEPLRIVGMVPEGGAPSPQPSTNTGLAVSGVAAVMPYGAPVFNAISKSTKFPEVTGAVARGLTTAASLYNGITTGNPITTFGAPAAGWMAGKGGFFLGRDFQKYAAEPVAKVLSSVAPYAQSLATLGGAQSLLDLGQVAEPNRQDIGTLGVSVGTPRSDAEKTAHPALLNMLAGKVQEGIQALMHYGLSREDAVKAISDQTIRR